MGWRYYPPTLISGSVHRKGERKKSEQWVERASKTISAGMGSIWTSKGHKGSRHTNTAASGGQSVGLSPHTSALVHRSVACPTPTTVISPLLFPQEWTWAGLGWPHPHTDVASWGTRDGWKQQRKLSVQTLAPPCPITHWTLQRKFWEERVNVSIAPNRCIQKHKCGVQMGSEAGTGHLCFKTNPWRRLGSLVWGKGCGASLPIQTTAFGIRSR